MTEYIDTKRPLSVGEVASVPIRFTHTPTRGRLCTQNGERKHPHVVCVCINRIGTVASRSGVAVSTLHFYEREGLIESWRTNGNQRRYSRDVLRRIAIVRVAQQTGVPLAEIRDALAAVPSKRTPTAEDWRRLSTFWNARLEERIRALTQLRDELEGCIGCGCLSMTDCPLRNPGDRLGQHGPGPVLLLQSRNTDAEPS